MTIAIPACGQGAVHAAFALLEEAVDKAAEANGVEAVFHAGIMVVANLVGDSEAGFEKTLAVAKALLENYAREVHRLQREHQ